MNAGVFAFFFILVGSGQWQLMSCHRVHSSDYFDPSAYIEDWTLDNENETLHLPSSYLHSFGYNHSWNGYSSNEDGAKLRYYFGSRSDYKEWPLSEAHKIFSYSWYDPSKPTVIFTHGFTGFPEGLAVVSVVGFFIEEGKSNVILLNWQHLAAHVYPSFVNSYLNWAAPNAIKVGAEFAETLLNLSKTGLDLGKTHLVGHSLGAHIFGIAGNRISERGVQLPWITGLDPSSAVFDMKPAHMKLNPNSARYVSVVHSDPSKYGSSKELGLVNFWPNYRNRGPVLQPGCPAGRYARFSSEDLCSHHRCWQLLIDSYKYRGTLIGSYARSFRIWKNYSKDERNADVLGLETYNPVAKPGNYYLITAGKSPYGLGEDGL
ncbi:phospholipase A1 isoform X2 [Bombyx mori]|uniref:Lipase domain-containing protein n=1 Tax=Bombyx mori TaxID=7091 RepID=A0A8R1WJ29_BOMMO|nr:phospholipase A1 [Bombyx mori]